MPKSDCEEIVSDLLMCGDHLRALGVTRSADAGLIRRLRHGMACR